MVRLNNLLEMTPKLSVTLAVKLKVPRALGVPLIVPLVLSAKPVGRVPESTVQVYGVTPLVAASVVV